MLRFLRKEGIESCVICSESDEHLVQCKDEESWLYRAATIRQYRQSLDLSNGERDFPQSTGPRSRGGGHVPPPTIFRIMKI